MVFSSPVLNLAKLSSSTPAESVRQFGNLYFVFLWEFALCFGVSQGLPLLAGMQGSGFPASTTHRLSQLLLGAAGGQDADVWLRGVC